MSAQPKSFYRRYGPLILVAFAILTVPMGYGVFQAQKTNDNDVRQWLPVTAKETVTYRRFRENFGADDFAMVSWEGCTIDDPRLVEFPELLVPTDAPLTEVSESFEAAATDAHYQCTLDTNLVALLPPASSAQGAFLDIEVVGGEEGNTLTIRPAQGEKIGHESEYELTTASEHKSLKMRSDGQQWNPLYFDRVMTGRSMLDQLTGEPFNLPQGQAISRIRGITIGNDRESSCAVIILSEEGEQKRKEAIEAIRVAAKVVGIPSEDMHMAGDHVVNAAIDVESKTAIRGVLPFSAFVALIVAWISLRSIRLTMAIFIVAIFCGGLSEAMVYYFGNLLMNQQLGTWLDGVGIYVGSKMNLILVVMPIMTYVLTLSGAVHLVNYYRDAIDEEGFEGAAGRAIAHGWKPCALAAATTAVGVGSLYISHIRPVKDFGLYSAFGLLLSLGGLFLFLPALLELLARWDRRRHQEMEQSIVRKPANSKWTMRIRSAGETIVNRHAFWTTACLIILAAFALGVQHIKTSVRPRSFFADTHPLNADLAWLDARFGPQTPVEIVVNIDLGKNKTKIRDRMQLIEAIQKQVEEMEVVGKTLSAVTFAPELDPPPRGKGILGVLRKAMESAYTKYVNDKLEENRGKFVDSKYLSEDTEKNIERWRISARMGSVDPTKQKELDYGEFLGAVEKTVKDYHAALAAKDPGRLAKDKPARMAGVTYEYTGMVPLFFVAQNELLDGLFKSFILAFVIIAVLMMFLLRSFRAGMLSMLPNVFPAAVIFGGMGWAGTIVDIGSMMTASVAMGIAVDDTLHFLHWFRHGMDNGMDRREAVIYAFERTSVAMLQTTSIAGMSLVMFYLSSFQPVAQFGLLMYWLLIGALVGDLIFLPALLAGPVGKIFEKKQAKREEAANEKRDDEKRDDETKKTTTWRAAL